jgi:hypothetical protein
MRMVKKKQNPNRLKAGRRRFRNGGPTQTGDLDVQGGREIMQKMCTWVIMEPRVQQQGEGWVRVILENLPGIPQGLCATLLRQSEELCCFKLQVKRAIMSVTDSYSSELGQKTTTLIRGIVG